MMPPDKRTAQRKKKADGEQEVLLARVLDLPVAQQLQVHHDLTEALGGELGKETARAKQARLRHEALEAMQAAAAHLGLPDGQAPTVTQFKKAARETELPMTFKAAYAAFENRWETASRFFEGKTVPETAAQRRIRRVARRDNRVDMEPPIACLRLFLAQDPPPRSTGLADYNEWARETNENLPPGWERLLEDSAHIRVTLRLPRSSAGSRPIPTR
jgi:hypothetical protein